MKRALLRRVYSYIDGLFESNNRKNKKKQEIKQEQTVSLDPLWIRNDIYLLGGSDGDSNILSSVWTLKAFTKEWEEKSKMIDSRMNFRTFFHKNKIYVCGGCGKDGKYAKKIEVYDSNKNVWSELTVMKHKLIGFGMAIMDDYIYIVGGRIYGGIEVRRQGERFSLKDNHWEEIEPMSEPRREVQLITMFDRLYAIGSVRDVEEYDPIKNEWIYHSRTNFLHHSNISATNILGYDDCIFVLSRCGFEILTFTSNTWKTQPQLEDNNFHEAKMVALSRDKLLVFVAYKNSNSPTAFIHKMFVYQMRFLGEWKEELSLKKDLSRVGFGLVSSN